MPSASSGRPKAVALGVIVSFAVVMGVALAGGGLAQANDGPPPPISCDVRVNEQGQVELTWRGGGDLLSIVRDGAIVSTVFLREEGSRWLDNEPPGGPATYGIATAETFNGPIGDVLTCGTIDTPPPGDGPDPTTTTTTTTVAEPVPESPPSCTVEISGDETIVTWVPSSNREFAIWRNGRIVLVQNEKDGNRWVDTVRSGTTHYSVSGQVGDEVSPRTYCGKVTAPPQESRCTATFDDDLIVNGQRGGFRVTWSGMGDGEVVISRTVDGSPWYWRGRTSAASFEDTTRRGDISYRVSPRFSGVTTDCTSS